MKGLAISVILLAVAITITNIGLILKQPQVVVVNKIESVVEVGVPNPVLGDIKYIGSGVVVNPKGHILTANHVAMLPDSMIIKFYDGTISSATVVARNKKHDLALMVVKIDNKLNYAKVASKVHFGEQVIIISHPGTFSWNVTVGVMSNNIFNTAITDTVANSGSSGGPAFDRKGRLIGIVLGLAGPLGIPVYQGHTIMATLHQIQDFLAIYNGVNYDRHLTQRTS